MARVAREEVFSPGEVAIVHVMNRVVRRCFLLGDDEVTGKNYDHRKVWIEELFRHFAACFGIDLLAFAILSNHFHVVPRSRPDVVGTWDDTEVARRWLLLCPLRRQDDGKPEEPNESELDSIRNDPDRVAEIRSRLSDISWWMRLLCQRIAMRANAEDGELGKFWQNRFRAVRLLDEPSLLACAAYVDLNPIRAAMAETLEESDFTSVQRRIEARQEQQQQNASADRFLAPIMLDERAEQAGPCRSDTADRCSDKGFLPMPLTDYLQLLDWTAREVVSGKPGSTPAHIQPILARLSLEADTWTTMVENFGKLFIHLAGDPRTVDEYRSPVRGRRFHVRREARQLLTTTT